MRKFKHFETRRLYVRPTTEADADFIYELLNTPKWLEHIGDRNVHSVEDALQYIKNKISPQLERLGFANYTLIRKSDGVKIGTCGLYDREGVDGVDIGFAMLPAYEGMGYGFESASKVLEIGKTEFYIEMISAITTRNNLASQRLIEKLGLRYIETIRIPNDEEELLLYRLEY
jgi:RimJ/RimL family protein N-acetyltransferase